MIPNQNKSAMADTVKNNNDNLIVSYLAIRKAIGWLGLLLPFILLIGNYVINKLDVLNSNFFIRTDCYKVPYASAGSFKFSISHYYYSTVGELFTGVMCAVALFMFCYKGHKLRHGKPGWNFCFRCCCVSNRFNRLYL